MIREVDRARYAYHKHFAKYAPGDPQHKHIIINSALLEVEGTAQALAMIAREKFGETGQLPPGQQGRDGTKDIGPEQEAEG